MYIYRFCFVLLCIWRQFSKYKPPGGLYLEGRFNRRFLCYRFMLYRGSLPYFLLLLGLRISLVIPRTSIFIWGLLYRGSPVVSSEYRSIHWSLNVVLRCKLLGLKEEMTLIKIVTDNHYYSFKIFLRFWLAKIPRIIHHNQLQSTKFGGILRYLKNDVNCAA